MLPYFSHFEASNGRSEYDVFDKNQENQKETEEEPNVYGSKFGYFWQLGTNAFFDMKIQKIKKENAFARIQTKIPDVSVETATMVSKQTDTRAGASL